MSRSAGWPALPYEEWRETCDTLHAHTQVLGKLAATLAPPEPQLQHAALRLTARGWETLPLPAPDGSEPASSLPGASASSGSRPRTRSIRIRISSIASLRSWPQVKFIVT